MKIWIDGQCLQTVSRLRGIGRYAMDLIQAMATHHPQADIHVSFNGIMMREAVVARDFLSAWIKPENMHLWQSYETLGEMENGHTDSRKMGELALAHHVELLAPDIALSASPFEGSRDAGSPFFPAETSSVASAGIFYDAIPHRFPDTYLPYKEFKEYYYRRLEAYNRFDLILAISEFAAREARDLLPGKDVVNISAGLSDSFLQALGASSAPPSGQDYLLYVGGLDWRKNVSVMIKAIAKLEPKLRSGYRLVIVGSPVEPETGELKKFWSDQGLRAENLEFAGVVSEKRLIELYKNAAIAVQPSLMEGFGLTVLEAMMAGTPSIGANTGAVPEVLKSPEYMFDPLDEDELARLITRVITDAGFRTRMIEKNRERAATFTWERTAAIALEALEGKCAGETPVPDLRQVRAATLKSVRKLKVDAEPKARIMALSEPDSEREGRLLLEATSTTLIDHKSGIQRVVKKICHNFLHPAWDDPAPSEIVFSDGMDGWYRVGMNDDGTFKPIAKNKKNRIVPTRNDHIFMLDSSWAFYPTYQATLIGARARGCEVTSCLYDLVPVNYPAFCDPGMPIVFSEWFKYALTYSTGFICISKAVADELYTLLEKIKFPRRMKIGHWQLGANFASLPATGEDKPPKKRPLFLMVGTMEPRKGHRVALEAFTKLWKQGVDVDLAIVGKLGWGIAYLKDILEQHPEYGKRLKWYNFASDEELSQLYTDCDALIAASYAEGFGLPIVEAGFFGKPVIASDLPVFKEVAFGAPHASFFPVGSADGLAEAVEQFMKLPQRPGAVDRGWTPSWPDWMQSARQVEDVLVHGNWYKIYEPPESSQLTPLHVMGETTPDPSKLLGRRGNYKITLAEPPVESDDNHHLVIKVRIKNLSTTVFSTQAQHGQPYSMALSYHLLHQDKRMLNFDNARQKIPFAIPPGGDVILPVYVAKEWLGKGAEWVEIDLVLEGMAWLDEPLLVKFEPYSIPQIVSR